METNTVLQGRKPGECTAPAHNVTPLWMLVGSWESMGERPCVFDLPGAGRKASQGNHLQQLISPGTGFSPEPAGQGSPEVPLTLSL